MPGICINHTQEYSCEEVDEELICVPLFCSCGAFRRDKRITSIDVSAYATRSESSVSSGFSGSIGLTYDVNLTPVASPVSPEAGQFIIFTCATCCLSNGQNFGFSGETEIDSWSSRGPYGSWSTVAPTASGCTTVGFFSLNVTINAQTKVNCKDDDYVTITLQLQMQEPSPEEGGCVSSEFGGHSSLLPQPWSGVSFTSSPILVKDLFGATINWDDSNSYSEPGVSLSSTWGMEVTFNTE